MKTLRILVPLHTMPHIKSVITIFFENLISVLKTKYDVHILWLVYTPEKIDFVNISGGSTILDIHDYQNAVEVIRKEKPDLVYAGATWNFIDYALSSAANFFNIPVFCMVYSDILIQKGIAKNLALNITRFFQSSVVTDTEQNKKKFMRRGRFFLYKYSFLVKTKFALKQDMLQTLFTIWKFILKDKLDSRFGSETIQFLENESLLNRHLEMGFKKSHLVVTGNPIYDAFFLTLNSNKLSNPDNKIIRVLFAPSTLYEHGFWTKSQRDRSVKEVVEKIVENKKEMSLVVKIHPSTSILSEYQSIIHTIDPSIPIYQKGGIDEFLKNVDVVITFQSSTAEVYALLSKIPVVIYNPFDILGDIFLERNLAIECKELSTLIQSIRQALSFTPEYDKKRENFIKEFMYKADGQCATRICDKIVTLLQKTDHVN